MLFTAWKLRPELSKCSLPPYGPWLLSEFISIASHMLFPAAHDKLLTWKASLLLFILNLLLFFLVYPTSSSVSFKTWPKSLFLYEMFPGSCSGRDRLSQYLYHDALINAITYHNVVQSLACLTVFLLDCELIQSRDFCLYYHQHPECHTRYSNVCWLH